MKKKCVLKTTLALLVLTTVPLLSQSANANSRAVIDHQTVGFFGPMPKLPLPLPPRADPDSDGMPR